ncbi:MAG: hypothetical protein ACK5TP_10670, partial [bacterium]
MLELRQRHETRRVSHAQPTGLTPAGLGGIKLDESVLSGTPTLGVALPHAERGGTQGSTQRHRWRDQWVCRVHIALPIARDTPGHEGGKVLRIKEARTLTGHAAANTKRGRPAVLVGVPGCGCEGGVLVLGVGTTTLGVVLPHAQRGGTLSRPNILKTP